MQKSSISQCVVYYHNIKYRFYDVDRKVQKMCCMLRANISRVNIDNLCNDKQTTILSFQENTEAKFEFFNSFRKY